MSDEKGKPVDGGTTRKIQGDYGYTMKITIIRFLFHQALSCHHSLVALEVTLSLQRLVKKYGHELHVVAWDAVLDIIEALQRQIEVWNDNM